MGRLEQERVVRGVGRRGGGHSGVAAAGITGSLSLVLLQRLAAWAVPTPRRYAPTLPLGLLVLSGAAARGAISRMSGRGPRWRGRSYPRAR
jgi:hypothetical protein